MSKPFDFGGVNLTAGEDSSVATPKADTPFCIAILGDFSGRGNRRVSEPRAIGERRPVLVDRDNFDEVIARFHPEIRLPLGDSGSLQLRFAELEDFHPDRIFENLEAFGTLRNMRSRLQDPSTFTAAAEELGIRSSRPASASPESAPVRPPSATALASGSLLDEMIEQTESRVSERSARRVADPVRDFAQRVAAQNLVSTPDPRQPEILAVMDRSISALMRAILHNPDFQALEAIWRATYLLIRHLETGSQLKLYLIDISKEELGADLATPVNLGDTGLYRLLVERSVGTRGADPWSVIVGNFTFAGTGDDVTILSRMAQLARKAGAPFLAQASPQRLGTLSLAKAPHPRDWTQPVEEARWAEFRSLPEAASLGLALPRFLLRLPYGEKTSSLESFDFEEFSDASAHEDYLWGNPAFALALMLGQSFSGSGWEMRVGACSEMNGLPLHIRNRGGEPETTPCAEVLLTEDAVDRILDAGLIPLVSFKNRDSVRVARFQSVASPARPLAGRWV